jgi:hypothetical protein
VVSIAAGASAEDSADPELIVSFGVQLGEFCRWIAAGILNEWCRTGIHMLRHNEVFRHDRVVHSDSLTSQELIMSESLFQSTSPP